jgi:hypothetical protein
MSQPQSTFPEGEQWQEHMDRVFKIKEQKDRLEDSGKLVEDLKKLELPPAGPKIAGGFFPPRSSSDLHVGERFPPRITKLEWHSRPRIMSGIE